MSGVRKSAEIPQPTSTGVRFALLVAMESEAGAPAAAARAPSVAAIRKAVTQAILTGGDIASVCLGGRAVRRSSTSRFAAWLVG